MVEILGMSQGGTWGRMPGHDGRRERRFDWDPNHESSCWQCWKRLTLSPARRYSQPRPISGNTNSLSRNHNRRGAFSTTRPAQAEITFTWTVRLRAPLNSNPIYFSRNSARRFCVKPLFVFESFHRGSNAHSSHGHYRRFQRPTPLQVSSFARSLHHLVSTPSLASSILCIRFTCGVLECVFL